MGAVKDPVLTSLYEADFVAWTVEQARALRQHDFDALDLPNLVEEIESMGKQQRAELRNRLAVLLAHLAKYEIQVAERELHGRSWRLTIDEQRDQVDDLLKDSPSLKAVAAELVADGWRRGRKVAAKESGIVIEQFPLSCPYSWDQITTEGWLPA